MIKLNNTRGFTIIELLIVIIMTSLLMTVILSFVFYFWKYSYTLDYSQDSLVQRLNVNDLLRDSVGASAGLINQNSIADSHANSPDPSISSHLYWEPLHAIPGNFAITSNGSAVPLFYYRKFSTNSTGSYIMNGAQPYEDEFILYIDSSSKQLLLRSLANISAAGNSLLTSCPPSQVSATCPADKILIENVQSIDLRYFSRSGNLVDWTSIWDSNIDSYAGPDFANVEVVELTINVERAAFYSSSNSTKNSTVIRVALRNY